MNRDVLMRALAETGIWYEWRSERSGPGQVATCHVCKKTWLHRWNTPEGSSVAASRRLYSAAENIEQGLHATMHVLAIGQARIDLIESLAVAIRAGTPMPWQRAVREACKEILGYPFPTDIMLLK